MDHVSYNEDRYVSFDEHLPHTAHSAVQAAADLDLCAAVCVCVCMCVCAVCVQVRERVLVFERIVRHTGTQTQAAGYMFERTHK
jgi:hypothetical protein